jgi:exopolysaccharide/PEP-CTERM locus tyrosine autokinase
MEHQLAGEYQRIKRPIVRNALGQSADSVPRGNLLAVTSSLDGEGKTFTAINLAVAISEEFDCEALLVDADVIRRTTSSTLGVEDRLGLTDVLIDSSLDLEDVILSTNIPGLSVVPAGQTHSRSAELVSSTRQRDLMDRLAHEHPHRLVVFDTPPILLAAEAASVVDLAGQVALVVKAGGTQQSAVLRALEHVDTSKPVNLILNQTRGAQRGYYYGGYYGY